MDTIVFTAVTIAAIGHGVFATDARNNRTNAFISISLLCLMFYICAIDILFFNWLSRWIFPYIIGFMSFWILTPQILQLWLKYADRLYDLFSIGTNIGICLCLFGMVIYFCLMMPVHTQMLTAAALSGSVLNFYMNP
jgi:hypothetical protein